MYYYGYFRNIDDSVDGDGQLFKVVIFDEYSFNGTVYPFENIGGNLIPVEGVELTMVSSPFTVQFSSDSENIYKPYKCSTASVSFLQPSINQNFLSKSGRSVLVGLLKWNNDVVFNQTLQRYENTKTGEFLYKDIIGSWTGFQDYKIDKFCYYVEWVGFATPETFSMAYDNIQDVFTLNCQDGLSVLQYEKFSKEPLDYLDSIGDLFTKIIADLGVYNNLYIADSLFIPSDGTNVMNKIYTQLPNYFDEDNEPCSKLEVLEEICRTLSLTMIAYGDSLYILDYNGISNGANNYHYYQLSLSPYFFNIFQSRHFDYIGTKFLEHQHNINGDSFSLTGTNISTSNTYNSVSIEDDDYSIGNVAPDIKDNNSIDTDNEVNLGQHYTTFTWTEEDESRSDGNDESRVDSSTTITKHEYWLFEGYSYDFASRNASEVYDKGVMVAYNYNPDYTESYYGGTIYKFDTTPLSGSNRISYNDFQNYIGVCALDYNLVQARSEEDIPMDYDLKRVIYFHTKPSSGLYPRYSDGGDNFNITHSYHQQKLLTVITKNFLMENNYLQIMGDWTFYNTFNLIVNNHSSFFPIQQLWQYSGWSYINAKVYIQTETGETYWLTNNGNDYVWTNTDSFVKLRLKYEDGINYGACIGTSIPFQRNKRGIDGIVISLPIDNFDSIVSNITVDIYRPLGVCNLLAYSTALDNFEINLLSKEYVDSMGQSNADENNTEYKQELFNTAVCDYQGITLKATTTFDKEPNYSHLICKPNNTDRYYTVLNQNLGNIYSGMYGKPEELLINNIVQEYKNPVIKLDCNLHYNIGFQPYSKITWNTQFEDKIFIIDSMNIDFELNRNQISLVEKPTEMDLNDIYIMNIQRQRRRNGELNTIDRVKGAKKVLTTDSSITPDKFYVIDTSDGCAYELTNNAGYNNDGAERFINIRAKFLEGDLMAYVPNLLDSDLEIKIENNNLIIEEI